jgi:hypothetical protein
MFLKYRRFLPLTLTCLMVILYHQAAAQGSRYFGKKDSTPKIPPKNERMRVVIVSDATNEIDDIWAIVR